MTNRYLTGNPLGSTAPKDLYDNASNMDDALNSDLPSFTDRFGRRRETWAGVERALLDALSKIGYESVYLIYEDGTPLEVERSTQLVFRDGVYYRIADPTSVPVTLSGNWATDAPLLIDVGDASLRTALAAPGGSALIEYDGSTVQAALDDLKSRLANAGTVDDFGAVGNGTTYDGAAFTAMHLATGGVIRLGLKAYNINGWSLNADYVRMVGQGAPSFNDAYTQLQNGSILVGSWTIRCKEHFITDWGSDCGTGRGFLHGQNGFTIDAPVGARGRAAFWGNIVYLGADNASDSVSHGSLCEGYDRNTMLNYSCARTWYGLIMKGRRALIRDVKAWQVGGTPVFIKSDIPDYAGFVEDATVQNFIVDGVICEARVGNATCNAVYVMASTAVLASGQVSNVQAVFGRSAVTIAGGVSDYCVNVSLAGIKASSTVLGVELFGLTFDCTCTGLQADGPTSGLCYKTSSASNNWQFTDSLLLQSQVGALYASAVDGTGLWNNFNVRSSVGVQLVYTRPGLVVPGLLRGDVAME